MRPEPKGYTITNKDFEVTVGVDRNDIEDDNLGVYGPLMQEMGVSAAQQPDDLTFGLLAQGATETCYDGQCFFDTDHPSFDKNGVKSPWPMSMPPVRPETLGGICSM